MALNSYRSIKKKKSKQKHTQKSNHFFKNSNSQFLFKFLLLLIGFSVSSNVTAWPRCLWLGWKLDLLLNYQCHSSVLWPAGDGGNDVSMIQEADCGVGVEGKVRFSCLIRLPMAIQKLVSKYLLSKSSEICAGKWEASTRIIIQPKTKWQIVLVELKFLIWFLGDSLNLNHHG